MENEEKISSIDALKANLSHMKNVVREIASFYNQLSVLNDLENKGLRVDFKEKKLLVYTLLSLLSQMQIINDSNQGILEKIYIFKELEQGEEKAEKEELVNFQYTAPQVEEPGVSVVINKKDKLRFLRELSLTDESMKRLKKTYTVVKRETVEEFKKPSAYAKISNRFFRDISTKLLDKGYFAGLNGELRKANLYFLSQTYVSMALFTSVIAFFVAILLLIVLLFFNLSLNLPFLIRAEASILSRLASYFWVIFALPLITFIAFYFYPSMEKRSISAKINQEIPFATIHMAAIAGSGIEPTKIFRIIVLSKEYPHTRKEVKKLLNEINIYGYDLVTALRNSAKVTSSAKLAELFNGLATTINAGGDLKSFLNKRSEGLIFDYRIEREKYTRVAETLMDIYISVVIAAPMIMTMLLVMINMTGLSFGLSMNSIILLMLLGIALLNVFFLVFLHLRQPEG